MHVPFGNLVSAAGTSVKLLKWWKRRHDQARRIRRRREMILAVGVTAAAIGCAITAMMLLAQNG
jgi:hypothetical protein